MKITKNLELQKFIDKNDIAEEALCEFKQNPRIYYIYTCSTMWGDDQLMIDQFVDFRKVMLDLSKLFRTYPDKNILYYIRTDLDVFFFFDPNRFAKILKLKMKKVKKDLENEAISNNS